MAGKAVEVRGWKELQKELRAIDRGLARELRSVTLDAARLVVQRSQDGTHQQKAASVGVVAVGQQRFAAVRFDHARSPFVRGAYFGAKAFPQFPAWVGNQWQPGDPGGPYVVGPAIRRSVDDIIDLFAAALDQLARKAFPDGSIR